MSNVTTPVAPVSTMGTPVPYITVAELKRSPIYNQLHKLVAGSSDADRDAELARIILRVSAMINDEVNQNLAASTDNEVGPVVLSDDGYLRIHTRNDPIISVKTISVGPDPYSLVPLTDLTHLILDPWRITVPRGAGVMGFGRCRRMWAQWTYVNGFPVTTATADTAQGATSITVADPTGILPNQTLLKIEDGKWLETVCPTAVTGNVLTVAPLLYPHTAGVGVSALPDTIKNAALTLVSRLHDTWSLSMNAISMDGTGAKVPESKTVRAMCAPAWMLNPYKRRW